MNYYQDHQLCLTTKHTANYIQTCANEVTPSENLFKSDITDGLFLNDCAVL